MTRDDLATEYLGQLPFEPYPVQEEALLAWFTNDQGVLVCAPTGTGKTAIAEAAVFEALHLGKMSYYTTPLIALTEQKFRDLQDKAESWGFRRTDIGLVTGNRRENPDAKVLVVVAEILLNRLLHQDNADFAQVDSVVMDEFHSFNDRERGAVWELTLALLPKHVRMLLLSATVGNAYEFSRWLFRSHEKSIQLVQSEDRKVPLNFHWIDDEFLSDQLIKMAEGDEESRYTPALVFCFNREECWSVAEQLKGKAIIDKAAQKEIAEQLAEFDWSQGAGPKLKQILQRGVGVHHAGVLPKYRRIVEDLFQKKLLQVCVCTETLAAGVNLPARSVLLPTLMKGPPDKKKLIEPSSAHQIFGRAGRPQFDDRGYVFALASDDDVKITRWKAKYDQIPEDTKDPGLRQAKKKLKKKMPKRRANMQYWTEQHFEKIQGAAPSDLASRGALPWRMLAHLLEYSPEVEPIRKFVSKRLLNSREMETAQKQLNRMLMTLWRAGYVTLEPKPPLDNIPGDADDTDASAAKSEESAKPTLLFGQTLDESKPEPESELKSEPKSERKVIKAKKDHFAAETEEVVERPGYRPELATPTDALYKLSSFRSVNPLFGAFLIAHLGIADQSERIQALESCLEMPGSVARYVRVPKDDELPQGPLANLRVNELMLKAGLVTAEELLPESEKPEREYDPHNPPPLPLVLGRKLRMLFDYEFPQVEGLRTTPVWAAGELLEFGGDFNKYVTTKRLQKQEGIIFRHLLRLVLLIGEFSQITPPDLEPEVWQSELGEIKDRIAASCQAVDPRSTEKTLAALI